MSPHPPAAAVPARPDGAPTARPTVALLRDATFGPFFWGNLVSNCGQWFHLVAAAVVVYNLTGSALLVGLVSVSQFTATLLLSPWAGALSDRVDRRRLLLGAQSLATVAAAALATWTLAVGEENLPGAWPVLVATTVIGVGYACSIPAMQALVPALVPRHDLDGAMALNSVSFNLARAAGPALAALLLVTVGAGAAFAVNAASYLALIAALLAIRPRDVDREGRGRGSVREGLAYVRGQRNVALLLAGTLGLGFATDPVNTLTPPLAAELGGGDGLVGVLVSAFGAGAALAAVGAARLQRRIGQASAGALGLGVLAVGMVGLAAAPAAAPAAAALAVAGGGFLVAVTGLVTALQRVVPEGLRGRVMALWAMAFLGSRPFAALLDGTVADLVGPRAATLVAATIAAAAILPLRDGVRGDRLRLATPTGRD